MATETPIDFPEGVSVFPDGTLVRSQTPETVAADPSFVQGVASKDIGLASDKSVWIRLYLPEVAQSCGAKLPIIFYIHGGGFICVSAGHPLIDGYCRRLALDAHAVVVSVDYRLAPEHRLPVAFDDSFGALRWLQSDASSAEEPWLRLYADYSSCFLMGHSAGASIVHQVALRIGEQDMAPLELVGVILSVPFFGGEERVRSEIELGGKGAFMTLQMTDLCWFLSLPEGSNRDHPYSNVLSSQAPQMVKDKTPPVLVIVGELDLLHDRQIEYTNALKRAGISVFLDVIKGADHGTIVKEQTARLELDCVVRFINAHKGKLKK